MKPSEISLFSPKEQTLLVSTETKRLATLDEDELGDLLTAVRRLRNKYTDLDRRQSSAAIAKSGRRAVSSSSNERTARKAEVLADAVSRVSRHLSRAARQNANELKQARLDAARSEGTAPKRSRADTSSGASRSSKSNKQLVPPGRKGATSAANKRKQASKDRGARAK